MNPSLWIIETPKLSYTEALAWQTELSRLRSEKKVPDILFLTEHNPVITAGKRSKEEDLLVNHDFLDSQGYEYIKVNRGGELTCHEPGQLVGYPILDLHDHKMDVGWYLCNLEETLIKTLAEFGIEAKRRSPWTGVWVDSFTDQERKIASIGVHLKRWITTHGFALNINNDLKGFSLINPCGLDQAKITSLSKEKDETHDFQEVRRKYAEIFTEIFNFDSTCKDLEYFKSSEWIKEVN
jgi:lipoate-protein ligase B